MKTTQFFAMTMAAAALLSSCSKEDGAGSQEPAGRSKMTLVIKGEKEAPMGGRAAGLPTAEQESTINDFIIYVFKANGDNDIKPKEFTSLPENGKVSNLEITTAAKEVYVVANTVSNSTLNTALKAVTKKSDLQAVTGRGFAGITGTSAPTQTLTNLLMSGKNDATLTPVQDGNTAVTVTLKYVAAKLRIKSVIVDETVTELATLTGVQVLNGAAATHLIPADGSTSLIPNYTPAVQSPFYVGGQAVSGFTNKPSVVGKNDNYNYDLVEDFTIGTGKNEHYFYVFENDGAHTLPEAHPTILTLSGMDKDSNAVYYSVFFKADPDGNLGYDDYVIERGKSYDVTMTIKKIGNTDPTIPALKTTVEVSIVAATWETVDIAKTYE